MNNANFFQIIRKIYPHKNIFITTSPELGFPATDILQYEEDQESIFFELGFLGLCGVDATLPQYFLKMLLQDSEICKNFLMLLQVFNTRFYLLLFEAWRKFQYSMQLEHQDFAIDIYLSHLLGFTQELSYKELLSYGDIFFGKSRSLSKLKKLLFDIIQHPVNIISNHHYWLTISNHIFLGKNLICGDNSILGDEVLDNGGKIIIEFFNFSFEDFLQYYDNFEKRNSLYNLTREFLSTTIKFSFCFKVQFENPRYLIGKNTLLLGWNSFLISDDITSHIYNEKIIESPYYK